MLRVLRVVLRPWRVVRRALVLKDTVLGHLRHLLDLQRELKTEVRELHVSGLMAVIRVVEEQRRARDEMAQECARLERRVEELERRLGASGPAGTGRAA